MHRAHQGHRVQGRRDRVAVEDHHRRAQRGRDGVCPELAEVFTRGPFEWKFNVHNVELLMLALLDVTDGVGVNEVV